MQNVKNEYGKTKYDLAIKIIDELQLSYICQKEAGYEKNNRGYFICTDIEQADKAIELYLDMVEKILVKL